MMRPFSMVPAPSPRWMAWGLIGYRAVVLGLLVYIAYTIPV